MRKGLKIAGSTVFAAALSSCLFYCMVAEMCIRDSRRRREKVQTPQVESKEKEQN